MNAKVAQLVVPAKKVAVKVGKELYNRSPIIFTGAAIGGVVLTSYNVYRGTIKAEEALTSYHISHGGENPTKKDRVMIMGKFYIPAIASAAVTIMCIIMAQHQNARRYAALAGLYSVVEQNGKEFEEKVEELFGTDGIEKVKEEITRDYVDANPPSDTIILAGTDVLCLDKFSGRYFKSDVEHIKRVEIDLNHMLLGDMWVSLNELYYAIGLGGLDIGEEYGWYMGDEIRFRFGTRLTERDTPVLVLEYDVKPRTDYMM